MYLLVCLNNYEICTVKNIQNIFPHYKSAHRRNRIPVSTGCVRARADNRRLLDSEVDISFQGSPCGTGGKSGGGVDVSSKFLCHCLLSFHIYFIPIYQQRSTQQAAVMTASVPACCYRWYNTRTPQCQGT